MQTETDLTKHLIAALFLCNYEWEKNQPPTPIHMIVKRGFFACSMVQYKFRPCEDKLDNVMLVLEFFSHQRKVELPKKVLIEIGNLTPTVKLRVINLTRTVKDSGYSYVVQLQGNTNKSIFTERS
jgi:hypothetical protein